MDLTRRQKQVIKLTCDKARVLMSEQLDGLIAPPALQELNQHLQACLDCTARWQTLRRVSSLFEGAEMALPPPDFTSRVINRLAVAGAQSETAMHRRSLWFAGAAMATTAALLIVVAMTMTAAAGRTVVASGPSLDILSMSMNVSGAAIWLATMVHSTLAIAGNIFTFVPPLTIVLFLMWLTAGTLGLAVTVASLVGAYQPLDGRQSEAL
jgi:anti-sigma factor RsiW